MTVVQNIVVLSFNNYNYASIANLCLAFVAAERYVYTEVI